MKRRWGIALGTTSLLLLVIATIVAYQRVGACRLFQRPVESLAAIPYCYQAAGAAQAYYYHLTGGNFARAAQYVAYYETSSDIAPSTPIGQLEQVWVQRVRHLKQQGIIIARVHSIEVTTDDGYPIGTASVTVRENGQEKTITQRIHFANLNGWKVQTVQSDGAAARLDNALSGYIP